MDSGLDCAWYWWTQVSSVQVRLMSRLGDTCNIIIIIIVIIIIPTEAVSGPSCWARLFRAGKLVRNWTTRSAS